MTTYMYVSLQPYTLQMRIAPNAKCQQVLVLALFLVNWLVQMSTIDLPPTSIGHVTRLLPVPVAHGSQRRFGRRINNKATARSNSGRRS